MLHRPVLLWACRRVFHPWALLECTEDEALNARTARSGEGFQLPTGGESASQGLPNGHLDLFWSRAPFCGINDGAPRGSDTNTIPLDHIEECKRPRGRVDLHSWDSRQIASRSRHYQVHSAWDDVAKFQKIKRAFVRDDGGILPKREPGDHNLFAMERWVISEPIEAAPDSDVSTALSLVREQGSREAAVVRLRTGEVAMLTGRCPQQALMIRFVRRRVTHMLNNT